MNLCVEPTALSTYCDTAVVKSNHGVPTFKSVEYAHPDASCDVSSNLHVSTGCTFLLTGFWTDTVMCWGYSRPRLVATLRLVPGTVHGRWRLDLWKMEVGLVDVKGRRVKRVGLVDVKERRVRQSVEESIHGLEFPDFETKTPTK